MRSNDDSFPVPTSILGDDPDFLLKVHDDVMASAGIMDGDWVVVNEQTTAADGDLVAVMIEGDAVVRTFGRLDGDNWTLLGKVISVLRRV
jgi:repressor LexA